MTEFTNDFSREIYELTYKLNDETIDDTFKRVAKAVASVEEKSEYWEEQFFELLSDFKFVPGGRILSNAGSGIAGTTLINCFVDGFDGEDRDSMNGIMDALKRQAMILKSEGGYGFNAGVLRPRGSYVTGIANETPGAVKMLEMWDKQSEVITQGSGKISKRDGAKKKIRKGAQLCCLPVWHGDIEEFITAKQTPGRLSKFNLSVGITDEFISAVKNHLPWKLEHPDYDSTVQLTAMFDEYSKPGYSGYVGNKTTKELYKKYWNGNLMKWKLYGFPTKVYKEYSDANELWDLIMKSTYTRNEPGVLFLDTINKMNNLWYCEYIDATNPCGEQALPFGGVCNLGSINLTQFINKEENYYDYKKLQKYIHVIIRFMDNINEIANVPLEHQKKSLLEKRRLGVGIMGYASSLLIMNQKYGSLNALKLTRELEKILANSMYSASALLAKEKGSFKLYNKEKYLQSNYIKILDKETIELIKENGIRNSHIRTLPPTGNTSVIANNVSSGLEPIFSLEQERFFIIPEVPAGLELPINVDWINKTFTCKSQWKWISEGDDNLLTISFENNIYKFDKNRGITKKAIVRDFGYDYILKNNKKIDKENIVTISNLNIDDHVETMKIFAKYIDSSISKTINLPNDFSFDEFKNLYLKLYDSGIKGGTTYRIGTMMSVISESKSKDILDIRGIETLTKTHAPKRPKKLKCDIHHITAKGQEWVVLVGLMNGGENPLTPYEVFAFKKTSININSKVISGFLTKIKSGHYNLELDTISLNNITQLFEQDEEEALTRMISISLRHGVDVKYIVEQLNKSEGTISSFSKAIVRALKKYIDDETEVKEKCPECNGKLIYLEGCVKCSECSFTKC